MKRARDEHRQAIEWLNQHTDEKIGFFLLEIELWRIDESSPAPKFNVVDLLSEVALDFHDVAEDRKSTRLNSSHAT